MRRVYLDHNATTPVDPRVAEAMMPYWTTVFGNPSSIHTFGQEAKRGLERARAQVAKFLNAEPREILFLSGGTEADNLAINGVVGEALSKGKRPVHVICSTIEHPAVLTTCECLASGSPSAANATADRSGGNGRGSAEVLWTAVPVDSDGIVRLDELERMIRPETVLISIMHANNEIGTIQPVAEIAKLAKSKGVTLHIDAVQSAGKIPLDVRAIGADLVAISSHKIYGPKGVGALWVRRGVRLRPMQTGGHQEREIRTGTENLAGIVGFGMACELSVQEAAAQSATMRKLRDAFETRVLAEVPRTRVNGSKIQRVPNTVNLGFEGLEGEAIVLGLDLEGIACSTGSACTSGSVEPSHVLSALGLSPSIALSAVRFSLGKSTTQEDVDFTVDRLKTVIARLRQCSPVRA